MMPNTTSRLPKPGDYAHWDQSGTRVLCARRQADGTLCRTVLALLHAGCIFGRPYRLLRFPHDAFLERNGVWRVSTAAKTRLAAGLAPRTQTAVGPYRITRGGIVYVGDHVPALPATFRCPHPRCGHRRVLDAAVLDVVAGDAHGAWVWPSS